jgi:hypothetical protein
VKTLRRRLAATTMLRGRKARRGQGLVEFSIILPVFLLILLGMLEFGIMFDHNITLGYASREGARVGAALVNGGGQLGCGPGQSPNAALVDQQILAAVKRVLTSPGSQVNMARIGQVRVYKVFNSGPNVGQPDPFEINTWIYQDGAGPVVDGEPVDFAQQGPTNYRPCERDNRTTPSPTDPLPHSIGVSVTYTYDSRTALGAILRFFGGSMGSLGMSDHTVMALNPTNS